MTIVTIGFEPKSDKPLGDVEIVNRAKKALKNEFGELFEFIVLNID